MASLVYVFIFITFNVNIMAERPYFLQQDFIDTINKEAKTWKAGLNFDPNTPKERFVTSFESNEVPDEYDINTMTKVLNISVKIPKRFDAREQWPNCTTIKKVFYKGCCESDWAIIISSVFADRLCIATDNDFNQMLSTEELLFCCADCWQNKDLPCQGGIRSNAWNFLHKHGIVTGGDYTTNKTTLNMSRNEDDNVEEEINIITNQTEESVQKGCAPYRVSANCKGQPATHVKHSCPKECYGNTGISFQSDRKNTKPHYKLSGSRNIQIDIMLHGPVENVIILYDDFINYKSGVYRKTDNAKQLGRLNVKILGWGVEEGTPYWIVTTPYGEDWGDNGFFRIRRGTNECKIENNAMAALPLASD